MSAMVFLLILVSSAAWSTFDMSRKRLADFMAPIPLVMWLTLLQIPIFALSAIVIGSRWGEATVVYWLAAFASAAVNATANVLFIESVKRAPFSLAVPVLALAPVFSALGGFAVLGEPISLRQMMGIAVVVTAVFFLSRVAHGPKEKSLGNSNQYRIGLWMMAIVALLWALQPVFEKYCLRTMPGDIHGAIECLLMTLMLAAWLVVQRQDFAVAAVRRRIGALLCSVVIAALALATQLAAIRQVEVGAFEALKRSTGLLFALAYGYFLFRESISSRKIALLAVIACGIVLLVLQ